MRQLISIHAPLAGCDCAHTRASAQILNFNPRTPCGVRLRQRRQYAPTKRFQSTHPLRGATQESTPLLAYRPISIHAPLAGCDAAAQLSVAPPVDFNPRTPCGVRLQLFNTDRELFAFQSTHPLRGATVSPETNLATREFQSTHPLRGATTKSTTSKTAPLISIHAPLAGCD